MKEPSTKFKIGDLIIFPQEVRIDPENDYGIVVDITFGNSQSAYYYHIHWALERTETVEDWDWAEENYLLVSRP